VCGHTQLHSISQSNDTMKINNDFLRHDRGHGHRLSDNGHRPLFSGGRLVLIVVVVIKMFMRCPYC
jgi:hypothetical protein